MIEKSERAWVLAWGILAGLALYLLHRWIVTLTPETMRPHVLWPLYILVISISLTMQMMSSHRSEPLMWISSVSFGLIMAAASSYIAFQTWTGKAGPVEYRHPASALHILSVVSTCWFVLMPFAQHRLARKTWFGDYGILFSNAWGNAVKLATSILFVVLFWGLLFLWAGLFEILKIDLITHVLSKQIFIYPATSLALSIGLALYAAKEEVVVGIYRAALNVLGSLLPLVALIATLFLLSLPFTGIQGLWRTGIATPLMTTLLVAFVFFLNTAWQDYRQGINLPGWLLRFVSLCIFVMPIYSMLCAYSLGLRVTQYGWSLGRFWGAMIIVVLAIYSFGYAVASMKRRVVWMDDARKVNIFAAFAICVLLTLTATPLLDPTRMVVDSQIERLMSGKTAPDDFDFSYLRFKSGKYGNDRIHELADVSGHAQNDRIRALAMAQIKRKDAPGRIFDVATLNESEMSQKIELYPETATLEPQFLRALLKQINDRKMMPRCFSSDFPCQVWLVDLDGDHVDEIVFFDSFSSQVFGIEDGAWVKLGSVVSSGQRAAVGRNVARALRAGDARVVPNRWQDFQLGPDRYSIVGE